MNIVILAAGQGKRMRSVIPKVLHKLAGRSLLEHVITTARSLRPSRICIVYGHGGDQVPKAMHADDLLFVNQARQLGTGHALRQALPLLNPNMDTLVLYGDVPLIGKLTLQKLCHSKAPTLRILTANLDDPTGYGRIVRGNQRDITAIIEEKDATQIQRQILEVNTGIMYLPKKYLSQWLKRLSNRNVQGEYYLTEVVTLALNDRVRIESTEAISSHEILGVNSKEQLAQLERLYQANIARTLLEQGVTLADPLRLDVRGTLRCGSDVRIDVNCVFEGNNQLSDGVEIGSHCVIRNSKIGSRTRIAPFSMIDESHIDQDCQIGPYARIRPGTHLRREVHIGNFVEVKAATIGDGSKANHLSYIGDSRVGRNVNVGAGTITCNYDGAYKHRTVIEDNVHIGSDVQLIAPVTVAKGTTIGAGTTVWKNTAPGTLVINSKTIKSIAGWKRPVKTTKRAK